MNKLATVLTSQSNKIFTRLAALAKSHREFIDSVTRGNTNGARMGNK